MGSGIKVGLAKAALNKAIQNLIIAVCDQPFVSAALFQELVSRKAETGKGIAACTYADTIGTPVLFDKTYFNELQDLQEKEGAKGLLKKYKDDVATVSFPNGCFDVDTEEDYQNLLKQKNE
jgi:molybdenum cofactor cytidylyltransferase